jgi:iron-sulfur cluster protein
MATDGPAIYENTQGFNQGRYESVGRLKDYEALKTNAREIKADAIERLPALLSELQTTVEENGGTVYLADDDLDARRYIQSVISEDDSQRVVKSKSMTTEEIDLNKSLAAEGIEVVETDLAEWVLQVAEEEPSHIVVPAAHKSRESIATLLNNAFDPDEPLETPEELTAFARDHLGDLIRDADVGITGANFITADTGTITLVTSEGNARKTIAATETQITVAGVEKIVPSIEDLQPFIELIGRSATGQDITSYISMLTPPMDTPVVDFDDDEMPISEFDNDREFHLVLIDNGRMAMRDDDELRETLYCIRCSACSNSCANFQQVGGHAFGGETYSGGIATGWEAGIEGLNTAAEFNDLCTGCSRCVNACPVGIDIPWINTVVRDRVNREDQDSLDFLVDGLSPDEETGGTPLQKRFFGNFESLAKMGSKTAPFSNWLAGTTVSRRLLDWLFDIDPRRDLPAFQRETLTSWFANRESTVDDPIRRAVLYPDLYTNHVQVERGKAAVRALEALGVDVIVPPVASSGRAPLSQGMIATSKQHANRVWDRVAPYIDNDRDIVVIEPSDHAMFQREYEKLLDESAYMSLADNSYELMEYVYGLLESGADLKALNGGEGDPIAYHSHCQQRTLGLEEHTVSVLERCGFDVVTSDVECCGMAGSFGYKSDYYELSMAVGLDLKSQFTTNETADRTVVASGTSCLEQLDSLIERPSRHPIQLLA